MPGLIDLFFLNQGRRHVHWHRVFFFFVFFTYPAVFWRSVSHWWSPWLWCSKKNKKDNLKFKLSVVKYAEENSGEAAARRFSVDPMRVRDWWKNKTKLEINMQGWVISKQARHERVSCKMFRAMEKPMSATVSDSRDEEFAVSAGWLNHFLRCNNLTHRSKHLTLLPGRMPENSQRSWPSL